ncbi:hypothetical protein CsSME_00014162 [Camellia sinensis var. sinensis]
MKGEYVEEKDHLNMFAKLHQTQKFQQQQQPLHHHPHLTPHHHHFQLGRESQTSDEPDSPTTATASKKEPNSDGATIEVHRRPRGRPPGSKNKPKQPLLLTRDPEPSMAPYILEIPLGVDLIDSLNRFCRKRNMGICVLTASGTVANVSLRQPMTPNPAATVTFHGRFDVLSLSATILPASTLFVPKGFAISLAGPQGQIVGGTVVGDLVAASTVYVVAASFNNPSFHRLPAEEDDVRNDGSAGGGGENEGQSPTAVSGGGDSGHPPSAAAESCGMPLYSCHLPSDVIWTSSARQQSSPHYG